jgi:hypothetical protein
MKKKFIAIIILIVVIMVGGLFILSQSLKNEALELKQKSSNLGQNAMKKISTGIEVTQIYASGTSDNVFNANSDNIVITVRLDPGSDSVKLDDIMIKFDTSTNSQTLTNGAASATEYGVNYLTTAPEHVDGYIVTGETVELIIQSSTDITGRESATIRFIAKNSAVNFADITFPSTMTEEKTYLYP